MSVAAFLSKMAEVCLAKIELHFEKVDFRAWSAETVGDEMKKGFEIGTALLWHYTPRRSRSLHAKTL
jgi:hypothetical protein